MSVMDMFRRQPHRDLPVTARKAEVKAAISALLSDGVNIEAVLTIFLKDGKIYVMQGGLNDDFEAGVFLARAQFLINRDGLPF